jgi:phosphoenolpyruvate carboxykinase (ATP)
MELSSFLSNLGLISTKRIYRNLSVNKLVEHALLNGEGQLSESGALLINTGKYTGRSPEDRFIVDQPSVHNKINWGKVNAPIKEEIFFKTYEKAE